MKILILNYILAYGRTHNDNVSYFIFWISLFNNKSLTFIPNLFCILKKLCG